MGIKGLYDQLGPGERVALSKLAADSFRHHGRPLRIAVDFAIWQFQSQAARGGTNPALRTLFYRLVRLMSTPVDPVFVFDGPDKPTFKRNKRAGRGDTATISQAKQLIRLLGFPIHDAPGEAEADCALLQQRGVVDAVLSEDVDTIMFGCTRSLRNWTAESRTAKTPTHVTQYDIDAMDIAGKGLDREGMVLVALMSGGDYLPDGILGCGVKVACEAAKAGYGRSLCKIKASDKQALADWRNSLIHELKTNESKFFRIKHSALAQKVPEDFPNIEVLRYYTHPVVSPLSTVQALKDRMAHHEQRPLRLHDLREFARTAFGWDYRVGGIKFIRVLGAALLTRQLLRGNEEHIERVAGSRAHFTTDGQRELRLRFIPENVVPVDLTEEVDEDIPQSRGSLALNSDDELDAPDEEISSSQPTTKIFDVSKPDLAWVLEDVVKKTAPVAYHDWQDAERVKALRKSPKKKKATAKGAAKTSVTSGAMDKFVRVTKHANPPVTASVKEKEKEKAKSQSRNDTELPPPGPPPRPSSKQLPPSLSGMAKTTDEADMRLPGTPSRNRNGGRSIIEAILLSSSPCGAKSPVGAIASPETTSTRTHTLASCSQDSTGTVPSQRRSSQISKGLKPQKTTKSSKIAVKKTATSSGGHPHNRQSSTVSSSTTVFKQTTLEMFAKQAHTPPPTQAVMSGSCANNKAESIPRGTRPTRRPECAGPRAPEQSTSLLLTESEDDDLPPISSFISRTPTHSSPLGKIVPTAKPLSPSKRCSVGPPPEHRDGSPSPQPRRKRLLVPRTSSVGFFKVIEVDEEQRDAIVATEEAKLRSRGLSSQKVLRQSDVSLIDLTQDD
ncbi:uncharacterized protein F5Z01DRAFT_481627 [Emericellopsis atlantica]|uniref:Flap structure-specific endonuclease n=1 Tax=Emericellopsis atlantica TaxID=2614577 RepID=A0A9P7ZRA2_9HYPO|nr:uncharacterized protein F5Z01DRAFT_481627 [Emericellopsis atlantica]KAG9256661.1 hypothetical protein F5Z01DRAFT_481627 [Emericellopsis atlantica]